MSRLLIFIALLGFGMALSPAQSGFDWVSPIHGLSEELARDLEVGLSGHIYAGGSFGNTMIFPSGTVDSEGFRDGFLIKFDPNGNLLWHVLLTGSSDEEVLSIALDAQENIYALVSVGDTLKVQGQEIFGITVPYLVLRFDSMGQYLGHFQPISGQNPAGLAFGSIAVSPNGRISIGGSFGVFVQNSQSITIGTQTFSLPADPNNGFRIPQGFVAQYDSNGTVYWATLTNGASRSFIVDLAASSEEGVVVCGSFSPEISGANPDFDFGPGTPSLSTDFGEAGFIARLDSNGQVAWAQALVPGAPVASFSSQVQTSRIAVDPKGEVYVAGPYVEKIQWGSDSLTDFPPPFFGFVQPYGFLAKASGNGVPMWIKGLNYGDQGSAMIRALAADTAQVFIGGEYRDTLTIGSTRVMNGVSDLWFASLDADDGQTNYLDAVNAPGFPDEVTGVAAASNGRLLMVGNVDPPADFGGFNITQPATACCNSFFVASYGEGCLTGGIMAGFQADTGGAYLINFTNTTQAPGTVSYQWDFGDGNFSADINPSHPYPGPGNYGVCLVASDSCRQDTFCQSVFVPCEPGDQAAMDFTYVSDPSNLTVSFIGLTPGLDSYFWDFGDDNFSLDAHPVHTYLTPGIYPICVITGGLCGLDTLCREIEVFCDTSTIGFGFSSDPSNLTVSFSDSSKGVDTYFWDFGDGAMDTFASSVHTYSQPGTYEVCLVTRGLCDVDTLCQMVTVSCDTSEIGFVFESDTSNLTFQFTNQSSNVFTYAWSFGDGGTSVEASPSYQYTSPGVYTVCLITQGPCDIDTLCQAVTAECDTSTIAFAVESDTTNLTVHFLDQSSNLDHYFWDFGDGSGDTVMSPTHAYPSPGTYTVCLIGWGPCDIDTLCQTVTVECDTSEIGFTFESDTSNLTVDFADQSSNVNSYLWSFGDGDTDTVANPRHQYPSPGLYTVFLITQGPCDIDTLMKVVEADCDPSAADFTYNQDASDLNVSFFNQSVNAEGYLWSFGDGASSHEPSPVHRYAEPGMYEVCLIAFGPCETDTFCQMVTVACEDSVAIGFTVDDISLQGVLTLTNQTVHADSFLWAFGDGLGSTLFEPTHQYQAGNYQLCLMALGACDRKVLCEPVTVTTSLVEISSSAPWQVFPNPFKDFVILRKYGEQGGQISSLRWYDLQGKEVWTNELTSFDGQVRISTQRLSPGLYLLQACGEDWVQSWIVRKE